MKKNCCWVNYTEQYRHIRESRLLDLPNNATKIELEHAIGVDTSDLAAKKNFIALKAEVDKVEINEFVKAPTGLNDLKAKIVDLDVGMLKTVPLDLKKVSDVVYWLQLFLIQKIGEVDNKLPDTNGLATTALLNAKPGEVDNKFPDVIKSVKKADYDGKVTDIKGKYFTTADYNKFTSNILDTKIKKKKLVNESNVSNLVNDSDLNTKPATLATKAELKAKQDKIVKLQTHELSYFFW